MLVFLSSPLRGDEKRNTEFAKRLCRRISKQYPEVTVIAPHLLYPQFLNDLDETERDIGLRNCRKILEVCDEVWYTDFYGVTTGMQAEVSLAQELNKSIKRIHDENVSLCCVKSYDILIVKETESGERDQDDND